MTAKHNLTYNGKVQPDDTYRGGWVKDPYHPTSELMEAVNLAIFLRRPLLIKGVPGCGKTRLADAVRLELTKNNEDAGFGFENPWPLYFWEIKSTSEARDGLYTYDAIGRLHDAQLVKAGKKLSRSRDPANPGNYVIFGPLGDALKEQDCRPIVLIDEIDKADIDFPNDLLTVLEDKYFVVTETGEEVKAKNDPIIFITSNDEKELPDAFLRRCVFYYIEFPDDKLLKKIINSRFEGNGNLNDDLVNKIIVRFNELRDLRISASKEEGTSELLDWVEILLNYSHEDDLIGMLDGQLPYMSVLVKNWEKHKAFLRKYPTMLDTAVKKPGEQDETEDND